MFFSSTLLCGTPGGLFNDYGTKLYWVVLFRFSSDVLADCILEYPIVVDDGPLNSPADPSQPTHSTELPELTLMRGERRKQRRKEVRKRKALAARRQKPGFDCACPGCPGYFNMRGLVLHL